MSLMPGWAGESDGLAGAGLAEDVSALASSLADGDWVEAQLHGVSVGLGTVSAVIDPVGAVASAAAGWVMDHIDPLRTWLDDLAGDPAAVMADSGRLDDAAGLVEREVQELVTTAGIHLDQMEGHTVMACKDFARSSIADAAMISLLLKSGATAMRLASGIVDGVRSLVRDAIAEVVGMATSSATTVALSGGVVAPVIATRVGVRVKALVLRLNVTLKSMARSFEALRSLLARAESALTTLIRQSSGRRPLRIAPAAPLPTTWSGELAKRLESISPRANAAEVVPGAAATVVEGSEE